MCRRVNMGAILCDYHQEGKSRIVFGDGLLWFL